MNPDICAWCEKPFARNSNPRTVFLRNGRYVGRVHTTELPRAARERGWLRGYSLPSDTLERDRTTCWLWHVADRGPFKTPRNYAWVLFVAEGAPSDSLTENQEWYLKWWQNGPLPLSEETIAAIRAHYTDLVREYRAWRAQVPEEDA